MIRGLSVEADGGAIKDMIQCMDCTGYNWYLDESMSNPFPLADGEYSGDAIVALIEELTKIPEFSFLRLRRYPREYSMCRMKQIDTYDDFLKSPCDLIVLYYDAWYCFIYSKDTETVKRIYHAFEDRNYEKLMFITEGNDPRVHMHF